MLRRYDRSSSGREGTPRTPLLRSTAQGMHPLREQLLNISCDSPEPHQLTLVLAPAGYAKTATVASWLEQHAPAALTVAWLRCSLLGRTNLWEALTRLLSPHSVTGTTEARAAGANGAASAAAAAAAAAAAQPHDPAEHTRTVARGLRAMTTIIIDNYELHTTPEDDLGLAELARASPHLSLVVISRRVALLDSPLIMAQTQVRVIGTSALRLTQAEAAELAAALGMQPSRSLDSALARTSGWPLAVSAALSASAAHRDHPDGAAPLDPVANLDAFALDTLKILSEHERRVLLATAGLDAISVPEIERLLDADTSTALSTANHLLELGFLAETASPGGTEYHCQSALRAPLAAHSRVSLTEVVRKRTYKHRAEELITRSPGTAFRFFCAAEDFETAERVLARNFSSILLDRTPVLRTLRSLPESVLEAHPSYTAALLVLEHSLPEVTITRLRFLLALWQRGIAAKLPEGVKTPPGPIHLHLLCQAMVASRISGRLRQASSLMRQVEGRLYIDDARPSQHTKDGAQPGERAHSSCGALPSIYRELAATALAVGDIPRARATLTRLLSMSDQPEQCPECLSSAHASGTRVAVATSWKLAALAELALTEAIDGDLRSSGEWVREFDALSHATQASAQGTLWAGAEVARAFLALETQNSQRLDKAAERLTPICGRFESWPLFLVATTAMVRISRGPEAALVHLRAGLNSAPRTGPPQRPWRDHIVAFEAMLNTSIGNLSRAEHLLHVTSADPQSLRLEHARMALFSGDDVEALLLAESLGTPHTTTRRRADSRLIASTAAWGCGRPEEAVGALSVAVELIERHQLPSLLLSVPYAQLHDVALAARDQGVCDVLALIEAIPPPARPIRYERLTAMELQALAAVSEHRNASQAAESLFVTTGTVKKHLAAVYRKLGVGDRDAAILRASRMGLLD